jgi:hypothetical protein
LFTAFPGQAMQREDDFVEGLSGGEQLLDGEQRSYSLVFLALLAGRKSLVGAESRMFESAGEHSEKRQNGSLSRHDISLFFLLEAATAGPRCAPMDRGALSAAGRGGGVGISRDFSAKEFSSKKSNM